MSSPAPSCIRCSNASRMLWDMCFPCATIEAEERREFEQKRRVDTEPPTRRDHFAMAALNGILADGKLENDDEDMSLAEAHADLAYILADAMIERSKK